MWIIVILLSAVWTLILTAPIHCRGSTGEKVMYAEFLQICSDKETRLHLRWPEVENCHIWVNYFKNKIGSHTLYTHLVS